MLEDDLEPKKAKPALKDLGPLSVEELHDYIAAMKEEITRVEAAIEKKRASTLAADAFFKK